MNGMMTEANGGDLRTAGGGCIVAGTEAQTIEHVLLANRGEYREYPLLGGEVRKMRHGTAGRIWCARARRMIQAAGVRVSRVWLSGDKTIRVE